MEALLRTYQLWAGLCNHVLFDTQPCPWIPSQWLSFLWQSMHTNRIQITYQSWNLLPLHVNDQFLMEDFNDQNFLHYQLEWLNACCMYLQVTTLSEITDHTGLELMLQILMLKPHKPPKGLLNISYYTLHWSLVHCPSPSCWHFWTSTIHTLYTGSAKGTRLTQPLGPWLENYDKHHFRHWCLRDANHLIYHHTPTAPTCVALLTLCQCTMQKFSPTVPTMLDFKGPQVTPPQPNAWPSLTTNHYGHGPSTTTSPDPLIYNAATTIPILPPLVETHIIWIHPESIHKQDTLPHAR